MKKIPHNKIKKEDLLNDILKVYKDRNNKKFTIKYYCSVGKYSNSPIKTHGGWNLLLEELGIKINMCKGNISKEDVINDFKKFKTEYDSLSSVMYRKHGKYSQIVVDRLFGGHHNLVRESGFIPLVRTRSMNDEEILDYLKEVIKKHGYINSTLVSCETPITYQTLLNRFGTMAKVYELIGGECNPNSNQKNRVLYFKKSDKAIEIVQEILGEIPIKEWTSPDFKNPEMTSNLYVDAYFPNNNIMIEYDGIQHYEYCEFIHKTVEKFERSKMLDRHKEEMICKMGIKLIRIRFDEPLDYEYIKTKLK